MTEKQRISTRRKLPATLVKQGRAMTQASYSLKLASKRVLGMFTAHIEANPDGGGIYVLTPRLYRDFFKCSQQKASLDVNTAIKELKDAKVIFKPEDERWQESEVPWLIRVDSNDKGKPTAEYNLHFNPHVLTEMREFSHGFTLYQLLECGNLLSSNQIRLYEDFCICCNSNPKSSNFWKVPLGYFERYQFGASMLKKRSEFIRRFLEPAVKQINENTSFHVTYTNDGDMFTFSILRKDLLTKANTDGEPVEPVE
ncbi:RepB family plasmid replication initiator protein [Salmonella enterica]|nr:RepB family plasmid replication initiator protein [Salmonella enterica]EHA9546184.1 RepB family plasmid replication initiator protein [Salmonella enterica subsp. enterica serovar Braenderup]EHP7123056.1 RepB family plasmid replication initiator protein [Salmonella enterica subsp. enterica serovar Thompson]EBH4941565.1 RepB family plasmid replication initiator protein [Salmonella enterica]ECK3278489.1 RepB family plasmid replication initiator protein [Salmonella enterica]